MGEDANPREPDTGEGREVTREMVMAGVAKAESKRGLNEAVEAYLARLTHLTLDGRNIGGKVDVIASVLPGVRVLYLYDNVIRRMSGLERLTKLTHLYLQNNRIERVAGLENSPRSSSCTWTATKSRSWTVSRRASPSRSCTCPARSSSRRRSFDSTQSVFAHSPGPSRCSTRRTTREGPATDQRVGSTEASDPGKMRGGVGSRSRARAAELREASKPGRAREPLREESQTPRPRHAAQRLAADAQRPRDQTPRATISHSAADPPHAEARAARQRSQQQRQHLETIANLGEGTVDHGFDNPARDRSGPRATDRTTSSTPRGVIPEPEQLPITHRSWAPGRRLRRRVRRRRRRCRIGDGDESGPRSAARGGFGSPKMPARARNLSGTFGSVGAVNGGARGLDGEGLVGVGGTAFHPPRRAKAPAAAAEEAGADAATHKPDVTSRFDVPDE